LARKKARRIPDSPAFASSIVAPTHSFQPAAALGSTQQRRTEGAGMRRGFLA
jgi:hypothetical protein